MNYPIDVPGAVTTPNQLRKLVSSGQDRFYLTGTKAGYIRAKHVTMHDFHMELWGDDRKAYSTYSLTRGIGADFYYMFCNPDDRMRLFTNYFYAFAWQQKWRDR